MAQVMPIRAILQCLLDHGAEQNEANSNIKLVGEVLHQGTYIARNWPLTSGDIIAFWRFSASLQTQITKQWIRHKQVDFPACILHTALHRPKLMLAKKKEHTQHRGTKGSELGASGFAGYALQMVTVHEMLLVLYSPELFEVGVPQSLPCRQPIIRVIC